MYKSSTFFLAHGVLRKNLRLELMLGFEMKQLIRIKLPRSSHPNCSTKKSKMLSNVLPCSGSLWLPGIFKI